ncbi:TetR family transcriptional regulator [Streptomyces sp. 9-7]|uniref:TetR family transcriptional regulator n=2 Tax=Streptomyces TaxID=1883 RepID=A0ABS1MUK3_9ACTN|nr:TetR family transcriptional regulator [Streptomyces sp. 9-7]
MLTESAGGKLMPMTTAPQPASLRERKKLRTRQALAETAVSLFTERGFDDTPLDALLEAVEVSRRTFFRNYRSKEDVTLTAVKQLWSTCLEVMEQSEQREVTGRTGHTGHLVDAFQNAILTTLERMDEDWFPRFAATLQLIDQSPSLHGHSLRHCAEIQAGITHRLGAPDTLEARLLIEFCVATWRCALDEWLPQCTPAELPRCVRRAFDAMRHSLNSAA